MRGIALSILLLSTLLVWRGGHASEPYPCVPTGAEVCDGVDNDCNELIDDGDPGGGESCETEEQGVCAAGITHCTDGAVACVQQNAPVSETCNGLDDDCDGHEDEGDPQGGDDCDTGESGICAAGTQHCEGGVLVCVQHDEMEPETCNGVDDDCNGVVDNGDPGGGASCNTGDDGRCSAGTRRCVDGDVVCVPDASPVAEICNGVDDDCDGTVDEGDPGGGATCSTGRPGLCSPGTLHCQEGAVHCVQHTAASIELCLGGKDEDCDGQIDEATDCVTCLAEQSASTPTQTKRTKVRLLETSGRDGVQTVGTFVLVGPDPIALDDPDQPVTLRITDGGGLYYQATIPGGRFVPSGDRRRYTFSDSTLTYGGIRKARFSVKSDRVTVKYTITAQGLDEPPIVPGTGTATVKIGTRCFTDTADTCVYRNGAGTCR